MRFGASLTRAAPDGRGAVDERPRVSANVRPLGKSTRSMRTKTRKANSSVPLEQAFAEAHRLYSTYRYRRLNSGEDQSNWIAEAQKRLEQIDWIARRISVLQARDDRNGRWRWEPATSSETLRAQHQRRSSKRQRLGAEIELLSEAFYYFAWRFRQVLVNLPEFRKFDPKGIRDVRHDLLDHPEKVSKALNPNFMYGHDLPNGPVLKPFGARRRQIHDQGLYANARELLEEFLPRLRRAVEEMPHVERTKTV
jgi:hypothetical protein